MRRTGPVYLNLSRGYQSPLPTQSRFNEGASGPSLGPYRAIRVDRLGITLEGLTSKGANALLKTATTAVYYDGLHFQEWSVTSEPERSVVPLDIRLTAPPAELEETVIEPEQQPEGLLSLEERFRRVVLLLECAVEDRLSILREEDEWERDMLLITDISDQIAHWEYIEQRLARLKGGG